MLGTLHPSTTSVSEGVVGGRGVLKIDRNQLPLVLVSVLSVNVSASA